MTVDFDAGSAPASGLLRLRVDDKRNETDSICAIDLIMEDGGALPPFTAGAHIDLKLPGDLSRSYSLINGPDTSDRYCIAVNRDSASRGGSAYVCESLEIGDVLDVAPPSNNFELVEDADDSVFFAGGIGITPILAMIRQLESLGRPWQLYYAARDRSSAPFLSILNALETASPGRVHLHFDDTEGKVLPLLKIASRVPRSSHVYCCGPAKMIEVFEASAGWRPKEHVHVERFAGTGGRPTTPFDVELKRQGKTFHVPVGQTILEVLTANGLQPAHSCGEGVCGTCETRVLEGIPDHMDNVLSPRERDSNRLIMICCSGAKTEKLVLDL